jgi:hypothetical protein
MWLVQIGVPPNLSCSEEGIFVSGRKNVTTPMYLLLTNVKYVGELACLPYFHSAVPVDKLSVGLCRQLHGSYFLKSIGPTSVSTNSKRAAPSGFFATGGFWRLPVQKEGTACHAAIHDVDSVFWDTVRKREQRALFNMS